MADSQTKTHVPQAAIFQSDPTEQIFSKGILDRDMSGLSYMFLNAAQNRRDASQEEYMKGVSEANRINTALHQQDAMQKLWLEALKQAPDYAKAGLPISDVPLIARLFASGGTGQAADASSLVNDLKRSMIAENYAKGANAGGTEFSNEVQVTPSGVSIDTLKAKSKSGDPAMVQEMLRQRALQTMRNRGIQGSGPGGTGLPNANPVDVQRTQEYNRSRTGN